MNETLRVACVQCNAGADLDAGIAAAEARTRAAVEQGARFVTLPEYFSQLDLRAGRLNVTAYAEAEHPALAAFRALAAELGVWMLLGSLPIAAGDGRAFNRSFLLDAEGHIVARYDKIHLFDVDLSEGERYRESDVIAPGDRAVTAGTPWGTVGLSICYDLRFPHLYRRLAKDGAAMLMVPAAFTRTTGRAHWHVLLRARAIENGAFVIAPAQCGEHGEGATYGHSLIVDPWGRVLADGGEEPGVVTAEIDLGEVARVRAKIPSLRHDRPFS